MLVMCPLLHLTSPTVPSVVPKTRAVTIAAIANPDRAEMDRNTTASARAMFWIATPFHFQVMMNDGIESREREGEKSHALTPSALPGKVKPIHCGTSQEESTCQHSRGTSHQITRSPHW